MSRRPPAADRPPSFQLLQEFVERVVPGGCARMRRFRSELLDFAISPTSRTIFLTSADGYVAETARLLALLRITALLNPEAASRRLETARVAPSGLLDYRLLAGAYAEIDATGRGGADVIDDLLGHTAVEGSGHPGLFERAILMGGRRSADVELTGGFVHIAEPADLFPVAQARLSGICAGVPFARVGNSEEEENLLSYDGVTIWPLIAPPGATDALVARSPRPSSQAAQRPPGAVAAGAPWRR